MAAVGSSSQSMGCSTLTARCCVVQSFLFCSICTPASGSLFLQRWQDAYAVCVLACPRLVFEEAGLLCTCSTPALLTAARSAIQPSVSARVRFTRTAGAAGAGGASQEIEAFSFCLAERARRVHGAPSPDPGRRAAH